MCNVFPSSLGSVAMRWFDNLAEGSIHYFEELTKAFGQDSWPIVEFLDCWIHCSLCQWEREKHWRITPIIIGSFIMKLMGILRMLLYGLLRWVFLWILICGSHLPWNPLGMYTNWWTRLKSIKRLRTIKVPPEVKIRLLPMIWGITQEANLRLPDQGGNIIIKHLMTALLLKWWTLCSRNRYTKFWIKSNMNHILDGWTKWGVIPLKEIKACIINITRIGVIRSRTVRPCRPFWTNWWKRANWSNFCNGLIIKQTDLGVDRIMVESLERLWGQ